MASISRTNGNQNGLGVYGRTMKTSVDFAEDYYQPDKYGFKLHGAPESNGFGATTEPKKRSKPIKVHSPKVRTGWDKAAVVANGERSRSSAVKANFDYRPENAERTEKQQPRGSAIDGRFAEIQRKQTHTEMDKVLNPSKERFYQPEMNPKCPTEDSKEFYRRNQRGTYGFMEPPRANYPTDEPGKVRCPSAAARENLEKGRGMAGRLIHQEERSRTPPPSLRLGASQESRENYDRSRGGCMSAVFNQSENIRAGAQDPAPAGRVIKGEAAEQNASRNRGQTAQLFAPGRGAQPDPQPAPRVRPEAQETAAREGAGMRGTFYGGPQTEPQPAPRVRLGGGEVASKLQGTLTSEQYNYRQMPPDPPPAPKVRPEAQEYANRERAVVTKNLLQKYGQLPSDLPPKPHVPPQAWNTAYRSRGSAMKDCINPSKPRRVRRHRRPVSAH
ncbi:hypothetical protein BOX15_Mlig032595g1 [Macrostomum lignano]|uniref:Uncharacterized protein n=2 Tax=Macrostomum lignano TaxID=282301 RepID=A0A267F6V8_9PLAT|nr:hypothetical protein BOX15_Mlig032595g2 [Macrostomum lignano]PAA69443.1 hypothetical protein BOX15_Mlig032595g1 [Macrostomum lignano]